MLTGMTEGDWAAVKDFMANGRFSRGAEVIADASLSFVGNIDLSVEQVVNSTEYDLFQPLPPELDLAVMDRFAAYIPGWEMPKNSSKYLTQRLRVHHRLPGRGVPPPVQAH